MGKEGREKVILYHPGQRLIEETLLRIKNGEDLWTREKR
jgi:hypothetical protein